MESAKRLAGENKTIKNNEKQGVKTMFKKTQNTYGWQAVQNLIDKYLARGGEVIELVEGCLGAGTTICFGAGLKTTIIQERYQNEWSSTHTIRMYNKMPKKYDKMIADWYNKDDND